MRVKKAAILVVLAVLAGTLAASPSQARQFVPLPPVPVPPGPDPVPMPLPGRLPGGVPRPVPPNGDTTQRAPSIYLANAQTVPATLTPDKADAYLEELNSVESSRRLAARRALLRLRRADMPILREAVVRNAPLSTQQTESLREVVTHVFLASQSYQTIGSGFLGVSLSLVPFQVMPTTVSLYGGTRIDPQSAPIVGVMVFDPTPGLAAYEYLDESDVIVSINGSAPFRGTDDFRKVVTAHQEGAVLKMKILRRGEMLDVDVKLSAIPLDVAASGDSILFRMNRERLAQDYWNAEFAPVISKPGPKTTTPGS